MELRTHRECPRIARIHVKMFRKSLCDDCTILESNPNDDRNERVSMTAGKSRICLWLLVPGLVCLIGSQGEAQVSPTDSSPTGVVSGGSRIDAREAQSAEDPPWMKPIGGIGPSEFDVIQILDSEGNLVPIPANTTWEQYQKWLIAVRQNSDSVPPAYSVNAIEITGHADNEYATVQAQIEIQVHLDETWVRVPLKLNEAILLPSPTYNGPGEVAFAGRESDGAKSWYFRGAGIHKLTLPMKLLVRKQLPDRRIQLQLPQPEPAVSRLDLSVEHRNISVKAPEGTAVVIEEINQSRSKFEAVGLGPVLTVSWRPQTMANDSEPQLQSFTAIATEITTDAVVMEADQTIRPAQGTSLDKLSIRLPPKFLPQVLCESRNVRLELDPQNPEFATVLFADPINGPTTLQWTLYAELSEVIIAGEFLVVTGFEIISHPNYRQTGTITIDQGEDYRVIEDSDRTRLVRRVSVSDIRSVREFRNLERNDQITAAFEFLNQPFRLGLLVKPVEPSFEVRPTASLAIADRQLQLDLFLDVQVFHGTIREIPLRWPEFDEQQWRVDALQPVGLVGPVVSQSENPSNGLNIPFESAQSGEFQVRLTASRTIPGDSDSIAFGLPSVEVENVAPLSLIVGDSVSVESVLTGTDGTSISPLPFATQIDKVSGELSERQRIRYYRVDTTAPKFLVSIARRAPEVRTESSVVAELFEGQFSVTQNILYDVDFTRLSTVRLLIPDEIAPETIQFALEVQDSADETTVLIPEATVDFNGFKQLLLSVGEPGRTGQFFIRMRFPVDLQQPLAAGSSQSTSIPVIQSVDAEFVQCRFETGIGTNAEVSVDDGSWLQHRSLDGAPFWSLDGNAQTIPITLRYSTNQFDRPFSIKRAVLQTSFDKAGRTRTWARYRLDSYVPFVLISFPNGTLPDFQDVTWGGTTVLSTDRITRVEGKPSDYRIDLSGLSTSAPPILSLQFVSPEKFPFDWVSAHTALAPQFPQSTWLGETIWEISIPFGHNLFINPEEYSSASPWERSIIFWSRRPRYDNLSQWIAPENVLSNQSAYSPQNRYQFESVGEMGPMRFHSMSQSFVVFLGAGLSLAIGFVLLRISFTRNALTVLMLAFAVACFALWFPGPVLLLLQPAILGLMLAVGALYLENLTKRHRARTVVAVSSPTDYYTPASSVSQEVAAADPANDPTIHRPASDAFMTEPVSSSDSSRSG